MQLFVHTRITERITHFTAY